MWWNKTNLNIQITFFVANFDRILCKNTAFMYNMLEYTQVYRCKLFYYSVPRTPLRPDLISPDHNIPNFEFAPTHLHISRQTDYRDMKELKNLPKTRWTALSKTIKAMNNMPWRYLRTSKRKLLFSAVSGSRFVIIAKNCWGRLLLE